MDTRVRVAWDVAPAVDARAKVRKLLHDATTRRYAGWDEMPGFLELRAFTWRGRRIRDLKIVSDDIFIALDSMTHEEYTGRNWVPGVRRITP
jgi:CDP-diacylglycerol pyrophosphatase